MVPTKLSFTGTYVALVTPFTPSGDQVDYAQLDALVEAQITGGTDGVVPVGTTGESPTLSHEEQCKVIEAVVKKVAGRIKVIAGTGSNSTAKTIEMTKFAKEVGADAALVVVPYYNKPTQEGLYQHFKAVADIGLPVMLYNIPGRSVINMTPATILRLARHPSVVAVKEASGSMDAISEIVSQRDQLGLELSVLSGDDSLTLPAMSLGASGVVSVVGNIAPRLLKDFVSAALEGDYIKARALHFKLFKVVKVLFIEPNPVPCKYAMSMMGVCAPSVRLPLVELSAENKTLVAQALKEAGMQSS
eukprot:TRINITY_DN5884_c0_g1_i1.p1 TRINITY_DN5884_c0_g1~~TRINITY_DN5884_c0_g1_i1.p1  ORF type:complete len:317 (-),score=79.08 TRINITY_DN5884_c0_g1_i1:49-957(-)